MPERTWDDVLRFLYDLPSQLRPGRQQIQVMRSNLQALIEQSVLPNLTDDDEARLFPLGFSPPESDLKIAAGVGVERELITPQAYEQALLADKAAGPFGFLQSRSGKTFGETVAPLITQFWIVEENDAFVKMKNTEFYDIGWTPHENEREIRIELKASSEKHPRFQQIRHPWMTNQEARDPEYDALLCLGLSNNGLEWWIFSADDVTSLIVEGAFSPQHGGKKMESGTYWVTMNAAKRPRFERFKHRSEDLRVTLRDLKL